MGKKNRKPFIDKKSAHHFYVMHRSQQDPLYYKNDDEGGSKYVLEPANEKTAIALEALDEFIQESSDMKHNNFAIRREKEKNLDEIDEYGLPKDGYNYHQHLAEISGDGVFISSSGNVVDSSKNDSKADEKKAVRFNLPKETLASEKQLDRMLEAITLKEDSMDPEIRELLNEELEMASDISGDEAFDTLNNDADKLLDDDFVLQLVEEEEKSKGAAQFNYKEHMARLMAEAEADDSLVDSNDMSIKPIKTKKADVTKEDLDFEAFLEAEYGDDKIGYGVEDETEDNQDDSKIPEVRTDLKLKVFPEKEEEEQVDLSEGVPTDLKEKIKQILEVEEDNEGNEITKKTETRSVLQYFAPTYDYSEKDTLDCQTVLTTRTTTENLPKVLGAPKPKKVVLRKENFYNFEASSDEDAETKIETVNLGEKRSKNEDKAAKKLRKQMVKEMKRERRMQKKSMKTMFKEEKIRQTNEIQKRKQAAVPPVGVSSFKI